MTLKSFVARPDGVIRVTPLTYRVGDSSTDTFRHESEEGRALPACPQFAITIRGSLWRHCRAGLCAK
ncbi:MAG: hypothetical protein ABIQ16_01285 [Polyangiaceae bacterium]